MTLVSVSTEWTSTAACECYNLTPEYQVSLLLIYLIYLGPALVSVSLSADDASPRSVLPTVSTRPRPSSGSRADSRELSDKSIISKSNKNSPVSLSAFTSLPSPLLDNASFQATEETLSQAARNLPFHPRSLHPAHSRTKPLCLLRLVVGDGLFFTCKK